MRSRISLLLVLASLLAAPPTDPARRPRYGGTLRWEVGPSVSSLDPLAPTGSPAEAAARDNFSALLFDRLVRLDQQGDPKPSLALAWQHDTSGKLWELHLRPGVKFWDASDLTPEAAATALAAANPGWRITFAGDAIRIDAGSPAPDLPALLAAPGDSILRRNPDNTLVGTGPFRISLWQPGRHAVLAANENYWGGRPFLDAVDISLGFSAQQRLIDLEVGKTDLVEIPPEQARRARARGLRLSVSEPEELLALVFLAGEPAAADARVREAIARCIDRSTIAGFLLQKQAEPAGGLLPQWSSGTAFLFPTAADPAGAKQLWQQASSAPTVTLGYDAGDALEQAVAERIVVNARGAGIAADARPVGEPAEKSLPVDARLFRLRLASADPRTALQRFLANLAEPAGIDARPLPLPASPEEIYARERAAVDSYRVVPLVYLPEVVGLSGRVRDWMMSPVGSWRIERVWLEGEAP